MQDVLDLEMIRRADQYLAEMYPTARARGEKYFRQRRVVSLQCQKANTFVATVRGSELYEVILTYNSGNWLGECTCPLGDDCKHVYAAMKSLLFRAKAGTGLDEAQPQAGKGKPTNSHTAAPAKSFDAQVEAACGRPLIAQELKFLKKLNEVYERCRTRRSIIPWDFGELGMSISGNGWEALCIWPSVPETLREFWGYVAHAALERGAKVPEFMRPVADLDEVQERLRLWQRSKEIGRWTDTLGNTIQRLPGTAASNARCELRLRLTESAALLEWKRPGKEAFEPLKMSSARDLANEVFALSPQAQWLWDSFSTEYTYYTRTEFKYNDARTSDRLWQLFQMAGFDQLLVNPDGNLFQRSTETLQWRLDPAATEDDDYRLYVGRADGSAVPPLLCVLPGSPSLYLTRDTVFCGPVDIKGINPQGVNSIPAPALETRQGATVLQALQIEFPPRLRERVRVVPLHAVISCALQPMYPASPSEVCRFSVTAQTSDGKIIDERHNGFTSQVESSQSRATQTRGEPIIIYDRSSLSDPREFLATLDARWDSYNDSWTMRVTKRFPEQFNAWLKSLPANVKVDLQGELETLAAAPIAGSVRLDATESDIDWFDLRVVLDVADTTLTEEELRLLLNARGGYVRLKNKGWRRLQFNLTAEEDERLARLGLNPRELSAEPQRLHALQLADPAAKKFLPAEQFDRVERRAGEIKARVTPDIPAEVTGQLRPYQQEGYHFLAYLAENRFGGILADDMGLGKTLQTLTWLAWLRNGRANGKGHKIPPALVVCPKSVMDNWRTEVSRFTPALRPKVWPASELDGFGEKLGDADLHVINYSQLRILGESLAPVQWLAVILDEGQYIKNPNSITAQIARSLRARHRLVLSGTPIENRLLDLWSLMAFTMPGVLGSRSQFARLYDAKDDPLARRRLSARVRPFLLRRTKSQVAKELPERVEEDLLCEIEGEQRALYRAELKRAQQMLLRVKTQKQLAKEAFNFLTSLLRLRQICCHPRLVKADSKACAAKVEALMEQLEPLIEEGHKVLVFSQFVEMLGILREEIRKRGWPFFYLAGDTENRGQLVESFQNADGAAIFLISLKAGGFGLNLTAANYVVLFDPWWNPAVENQAIDRTHRIGQHRNVIAYRLLVKDSIEEKIRLLQKKKSALAEDILGEEKFAQRLTIEDLRFLFSDAPA
ncbi:MAG: DEAD/DEAH box helicase [Verrucomicrobia subdivision 3 bacterium]|nr:DEAD/DEAH box helicase [Limisphaerales bacterium]